MGYLPLMYELLYLIFPYAALNELKSLGVSEMLVRLQGLTKYNFEEAGKEIKTHLRKKKIQKFVHACFSEFKDLVSSIISISIKVGS